MDAANGFSVVDLGRFDGNFCRSMKPKYWERTARIQFAFRVSYQGMADQWVLYWSAWQQGAKQ